MFLEAAVCQVNVETQNRNERHWISSRVQFPEQQYIEGSQGIRQVEKEWYTECIFIHETPAICHKHTIYNSQMLEIPYLSINYVPLHHGGVNNVWSRLTSRVCSISGRCWLLITADTHCQQQDQRSLLSRDVQ